MPIASIIRWALFAIFVVGCGFSLEKSPTFRACVQHELEEATPNKQQEHHSALISTVTSHVACAGEFIETKHDAVIAGFTVLLGFATVFLWIATRDLVAGAETASRRQLRAYLSIDPTFIESYGIKKRITFNCVVTNHGQTPAFAISYKFSSVVSPEILPEGWEYTPPQHDVGTDSTCFPKRGITAWFHHERVLTAEEYDLLEGEDHRLYVWGEMNYRDAFKKKRTTYFNFSVGGPDFVKSMKEIRQGHRKASDGSGYMFVHGPQHGNAT